MARAANLGGIVETVTYAFGAGLYDARMAAGLRWDWESRTWISDPFQSVAAPVLRKTRQYGAVFDCLPASEFRLGGVGMGDPLGALGKLGSPEASEATSFSDDPIDRMTLVGANIDFLRDAVVTIAARSSHWRTPSGLRLGLTRGEVIRILGRAPSGCKATAQAFTVPVCPEGDESDQAVRFGQGFALLEFGQDKRVDDLILVTATE